MGGYLIIAFFLILGNSNASLPRFIGSKRLPNAAYVAAYLDQGNEDTPFEDRYTLYVSTFNPINPRKDPKYILRHLGRELNNVSNWNLVEMDRTAQWPNSPEELPYSVFNTHGIVWTSGFLVPGKQDGALEVYDTSVNPPMNHGDIASLDKKSWSYHRVLWKDMDGDGDLDALTARFHKPIFGSSETQLLWLENPNLPIDTISNAGWIQHILNEEDDVHFRNFKLTSNGKEFDCILSGQFFNKKLFLYYSMDGDWKNFTNSKRILVDDTLGQPFDVYVDDFNKDGRLDLLVTVYNGTVGSVFAYEVPDNWQQGGKFVRHTIADGFIPNQLIGASMTPGSPETFHPTSDKSKKPYIMLSGDDDGKHYIIVPKSEDIANWEYAKHILVDTEGNISGKFAVGDFDGDGYIDIIAAGYSSSQLYAFTYSPGK